MNFFPSFLEMNKTIRESQNEFGTNREINYSLREIEKCLLSWTLRVQEPACRFKVALAATLAQMK